MTGFTQPDRLPFPNDYNEPADVPAAIQSLAVRTQEVLTETAAANALISPIGTIVMWPQASAPNGWHLCNGTAHGSAALEALLGSTLTPNLTSRFIVGAGPGYVVGATGGADAVALSSAQSGLRDHTHGAWSAGASNDHSHHVSVGGGEHNHLYYASQNLRNMDDAGSGWQVPTHTADHLAGGGHGHAGQSNGQSADHTHGIGVAASGAWDAAAAHENRPPFFALTFIIRKA